MNNKKGDKSFLVVVFAIGTFASAILFLGYNPMKAQEQNSKRPIFDKYETSDVITKIVRDKSQKFIRVMINTPEERSKLAELGTVIEDYGSFVILAGNKSTNLRSHALDIQKVETSINLPSGKFEPLIEIHEQTIEPGAELKNHSSEKDYYVVQFASTVKDEWLESLEEIGAEVVQYVPHQAFFVYADSSAISKVAVHSRVRWAGKYLPEQKRSPFLNDYASSLNGEMSEYDVAVFSRADLLTVKNEIINTIGRQAISVEKAPHNFINIIRIKMSPDDIENVSKIRDVVRIDPFVKPEKEDERAAQIVSGNFTSTTVLSPPGYNPLSQFGVDGTGVTVSVVDDGVSIPGNGGFYVTAGNTVHGPLRGAPGAATGGHGHINASIIAGNVPFGILDPTGYNYGVGIAPKANIINVPFLAGGSFTDAQTIDDTLTTLGPNGVRGTISNNSWGSGTNGNTYDSRAALWDGFVQDGSFAATIDPFNVVFSAGNSGTSGLTRPKMAKNVIAVANSENVRTELGGTSADNIDDMRSSSSRGPAADGRIKPDITAPGTVITGSRAGTCGSVSSCFDANHAYSTGTSHAAPQIAGVAALFTQFWKNNNNGSFPSPSLVKAAILNTGQEMTGFGSGNPIPNGDEGWGRVNMKFMFNTGVPVKYINQTIEFTSPGNSHSISGTVGSATKPMRVSLVWTDPPAVSDPTLINNLDLTVTIGANVYKGNVFTGGTSTTGGTADTVNNLEHVFIPAGVAAGTPFTIQISATALNGNGILGNADNTDQHFSLVGYNFADTSPVIRRPFDYDGDGKTDLSIFRPSNGQWWINRSSTSANVVSTFGTSADKLVPADYTGDGKTDIAFFRPGSGEWFILRSEDSSFFSFPFGAGTDIPAPGDFDGDGKADPAVFRAGTWFIQASTAGTRIESFGTTTDLPVVGDYDGDGIADKAIFRPSNGQWWLSRSTSGVTVSTFGMASDKAVQGDYTGDGKTDVAFWRPSSGEWFVLRSEDSSFFSFPYGTTGDIPVPGDFDGDGRQDAAVFRPSNSTWYLNRSTAGSIIQTFGATGDLPTPNSFVR